MQIQIAKDYLLIDGTPRFIYGGDLNYAKLRRRWWQDRMRKVKAAGMNTITFYCTWAYHEPVEDQWNFQGDLDVGAYLDTAQEEGLWVIIRIGPFVHGEMRNGGLPQWLFDKLGNKVRTNDPEYLAESERWYEKILPILAPRLITRGGPIVMLQMENELGSAGSKGDDVHRGSEDPEERGKHIHFYNRFLQRFEIDIPIIDINKPYPGKEELPLVDTGGGYPVNCFGCDGDLGPINLDWWKSHQRPRITIESGSGMFVRYYDWPPYRHTNTFQGPIYPPELIEAQGYQHLAEGCKGINWFVLNDAEYPDGGAERMLPQRIYGFQAPFTVAGNLRSSYGRIKRFGWFLRAFEAELLTAVPHETWAKATSYGIPHPGAESSGDDLFEAYHSEARQSDAPLPHVRKVKAGGIINKGLNLSESNFLIMSNVRATGAAWQRDIRVESCPRGIPCEVSQEYPKRTQMELAPGENKIMPFFVKLAPHHFLEYSTATLLDRRPFGNGIQLIAWARSDATVESRFVLPESCPTTTLHGSLIHWESPNTVLVAGIPGHGMEIVTFASPIPMRYVLMNGERAEEVWEVASPHGKLVASSNLRILESRPDGHLLLQSDTFLFHLYLLSPTRPELTGPFAELTESYDPAACLYKASGRLECPKPEIAWRRRHEGEDLIIEADLEPSLIADTDTDFTLQVRFDGMLGYAWLDDYLISDHAYGRFLPWEIHLRDRLVQPSRLRIRCTQTHSAEITPRPVFQREAHLRYSDA